MCSCDGLPAGQKHDPEAVYTKRWLWTISRRGTNRIRATGKGIGNIYAAIDVDNFLVSTTVVRNYTTVDWVGWD